MILINFNKITIKPSFYNPGIEETLRCISNSRIFCKIDLVQGYYQTRVKESDIPKFGFDLICEHYEFQRMYMGLTNARRTNQRAMINIFGHLPFVKVYLDDLSIYSTNGTDHENLLKEIKKLLKQNNIIINIEKSLFEQEKIAFLGKIIEHNSINIDKSTLKLNILDGIPKTKRRLQSLIGLINWYGPHISDISTKMINITEKLKHKVITWNEQDKLCINKINKEIIESINLYFPNKYDDFDLYTDASEKGIGSTLEQKTNVIGIYLKKL